MKKNIISLLVMAATLGLSSVASAGIETGKLVIWVNGDKGYDGLAKVGQKFTVQIFSFGLTTVSVNGRKQVFCQNFLHQKILKTNSRNSHGMQYQSTVRSTVTQSQSKLSV